MCDSYLRTQWQAGVCAHSTARTTLCTRSPKTFFDFRYTIWLFDISFKLIECFTCLLIMILELLRTSTSSFPGSLFGIDNLTLSVADLCPLRSTRTPPFTPPRRSPLKVNRSPNVSAYVRGGLGVGLVDWPTKKVRGSAKEVPSDYAEIFRRTIASYSAGGL